MRATLSLLVLTVFTIALQASQQTIQLTPQSLGAWKIVGTAPQTLSGQDDLTLPAGAQLAHTFAATSVTFQVTTKPALGPNPEDWPVLEIGGAALVFVRDGAQGKLLLVVGEGPATMLPWHFALDGEGLSAEVLTLSFGRQEAEVSIGMSGQMLQFPVPPASTMETVVSAGATQPWVFQELTVTVATADPVSSTPFDTGFDSSAAQTFGSVSTVRVAAGGISISAQPALTDSPAGRGTTTVSPGPTTGHTRLEIFTPSSVRRGRAHQARAAAAATLVKN